MAATSVPKLYRSVIEDVVSNVREAFLDEGVDEQVLVELKQIWEKKLAESKAIDHREPESVPLSRVALHGSQPHHHHHHQQQQQQVSSQVTSSAIAHQLTLPPSHLVQQALLQYAASQEGIRGDGQKTVTLTMPQKLTITLPAHMTQAGLQTVMSAPAAAATLALPPEVTASLLQQAALNQGGMLSNTLHVGDRTVHYQTVTVNQPMQQQQQQQQQNNNGVIQLDGNHDTSDDDDDEEDFRDNDDDRDDDDDQNEEDNEFLGEEEVDPLNSEDDVSDDDPTELFDTDNVVVCQYDKITRSRNRWKFHLKDGIMNLQGKDYVFQKAVGDAEWRPETEFDVPYDSKTERHSLQRRRNFAFRVGSDLLSVVYYYYYFRFRFLFFLFGRRI